MSECEGEGEVTPNIDTSANSTTSLLNSPSDMRIGSEYEEIPLVTSASSGESGYDEEPELVPAPIHSSAVKDNANSEGSASPATKLKLRNSEDIYAVIDKSRQSPEKSVQAEDGDIPAGWKKCYDDEGEYYWHIRTGRIQRDRPQPSEGDSTDITSPADHLRSMESSLLNLAERNIKSITLHEGSSLANGETSAAAPEQTLKFSVHSIGWSPLAESDLKDQETSSRSLNRCIVELTAGRTNEGRGYWDEGKELSMEIDGRELCLVDPVSTTVLSVQPIHTIRVWGVGSQNSCDFAYVARDPSTRIHKCHVFRCEVPARQIASTLKEICCRLAKERKARRNSSPDKAEQEKLNALHLVAEKGKVVLPSPMDGPSKTKKCHYLGCAPVSKPTGMDIVNSAIEKVANSTDRMMGMIIHTAEDEFVAHVFHCEPSAGALCKIIEAACKLRYQKLLDSMPEAPAIDSQPSPSSTANKGIQHTMRSMLARVWPGKKS